MLGGLILGVIAIFLPPVAVVLRRGCGADLLINILLCLLGWIPGVFHAWYVVIKTPNHSERRRIERKASRSSAGSGRRSRDGGYYPSARSPVVVQQPTLEQGYPVQTTGYVHPRKY
ncbi:hypothetical protein LTR09_012794 [Extremus antarcticus]|uniref:Stress response RCI peptide n=1 Tax=Extremus antarcticus TaxID=702011 RepID=A0AAJ0G457_9PEZI|nr:hypothetical protein LTR09_012794 [Extremus antarcticus]